LAVSSFFRRHDWAAVSALRHAAAATPHPVAAATARSIFAASGNAVDAAVAAILTCCVVEPAMVGLGGYGGSLVAYLADRRQVVAIDFDSRGPLAYRPGAFPRGRPDYDSGYLSITVPAVVAGLDLALSQFGTLPWATVSAPAIATAEVGVPVTPGLKQQLDGWLTKTDAVSQRALLPAGAVPAIGECWRQPDLAGLLLRLAADGPRAFYQGDLPRAIVRQVREHGGILAEEDFAEYRPRIVEPLSGEYRGRRVLTPPPPSGGIATLDMLATLHRQEIGDLSPSGAHYFHLVAEAAERAWADRGNLGDPDFPHTVNVVTADTAGNVVSMTATLGYLFGSAVVIDGLGLVMNHGMSRFDLTPGSANGPAPGKRMQHNMAPTIVMGPENRPFAAVGLPGGPKIVTVTAQLVSRLVDFGMSPEEAVHAGRVHAEADGPVAVSSAVPDAVIDELEAFGHTVRRGQDVGGPPNEIGGVANALVIDWKTGTVSAASQAGPDAAVM
jgi:gamma-glutamyltranspeptidase/glutathione hydrolase